MTQSYVERELKFDVDADFEVPDVESVLPEGGRQEHRHERLRSEYYDTDDFALLSASMTLRHRSGTTDSGWQLKVPFASFRQEIRVESEGDDVPAELADLLRGISGDRPLAPIAVLTTERSVTRLLRPDGGALAEIDDDTVRAVVPGADADVGWREVEVELAGDDVDEDLLYLVRKLLTEAGASPSVSRSKLRRALGAGDGVPDVSAPAATAGAVVCGYIAQQRQVILAGDVALRRGDDAVIHKTRVATRRLRSTLRTFAALFDEDRADRLDAELRWFSSLMGEVRDRQVLRRRLDAMLAAVDDTLVLGPVEARIHGELDRDQAEHWHRLTAEMTGERYLALLEETADWVREPPLTADAAAPLESLHGQLGRAEKKVAKRLERANAAGDVELFHSARKAAKRARYAAETVEPAIGAKKSAKVASRYEKLQDLLGEHQDSLVSAAVLRRLATVAGTTAGENGFTFGILHEQEQQNARTARETALRQARKYQ